MNKKETRCVEKFMEDNAFARVEIAAVLYGASKQRCWVMPGMHVVDLNSSVRPTRILSPRGIDAAEFVFSLKIETDILYSVAALFRLLGEMHTKRVYHLEAKLNNFVFSKIGIHGYHISVTLKNNETWYVYAIDFETTFMKEYTEEQQYHFDAMCDALAEYGYRDFCSYSETPLHAERCDTFALLVTIVEFMKVNKKFNTMGKLEDPLFKRLHSEILLKEINPLNLKTQQPVHIPEATGGSRSYTYFYVTGAPIKSARCVAQRVEALVQLHPIDVYPPPST